MLEPLCEYAKSHCQLNPNNKADILPEFDYYHTIKCIGIIFTSEQLTQLRELDIQVVLELHQTFLKIKKYDLRFQLKKTYNKNIIREEIQFRNIPIITIIENTLYRQHCVFSMNWRRIRQVIKKENVKTLENPLTDYQIRLIHHIRCLRFVYHKSDSQITFVPFIKKQLEILRGLKRENKEEHDEILRSNMDNCRKLYFKFPNWLYKCNIEDDFCINM